MASTGFFHGVEVNEVNSGLIPISQIKAGVIALVGVSPIGPIEPTFVGSQVAASQFGPSVFDGRSLPHALDAILGQGGAQVVVVNCYDAVVHQTTVAAEVATVGPDLKVPLAQIPNSALVVKNSGATVTLVLGTDYSFEAGKKEIRILNPATYPSATALSISYKYFDKTKVLAAHLVGTSAGARTGIQKLDDIYSLFGFNPKILIAPGYSDIKAVSDALIAKNPTLKSRVIIDAPITTTVAGAIAGRGPAGAIPNFNSNSKKTIAVFPQVFKADIFGGGAPQLFPLSAYVAGRWSASISEFGVHYSFSNQTLKGIVKPELPISFGLSNPSCDAFLLNAAGIVTLVSGFGTGYKAWGNNSLAFPSSASITSFTSVDLVADVIDESVQAASLAFVDQPLDLALIDNIKASVQGFLNELILAKAIIDGSITFDPAKNTPALLAQGKVTFDMSFLPPGPAQNIAFNSFVDISLFSKLTA